MSKREIRDARRVADALDGFKWRRRRSKVYDLLLDDKAIGLIECSAGRYAAHYYPRYRRSADDNELAWAESLSEAKSALIEHAREALGRTLG